MCKYGGQGQLRYVNNAGHLEIRFGDRIRAEAPLDGMAGPALATWLLQQCSVRADASVCQTWLTRDWSSSGMLRTPQAVEDALGDRLRLSQYRDHFRDDDSAQRLTEVLAESQPDGPGISM